MFEQIPGQMSIDDYISKSNDQEFDILVHIPTGLRDRVMRKLIHEARKKIPILNLQNGDGYFIPDMNCEQDIKLLVRWVRQEKSRIKELQMIVDTAERTLSNCGVDWR